MEMTTAQTIGKLMDMSMECIRTGNFDLAKSCRDTARCILDLALYATQDNFTAPRRGVPEAQKPPRQETGPSPAILEGTR